MTAEKSFRPTSLADYSGQPKIKCMLQIYIRAAKMRNESLDHIIVHGPSGCGKSTIAWIIANEMESECITYAAPSIKKKEDLIEILLNLKQDDILFIDEIHSLSRKLQEVLFVAMENFYVNVDMGDGAIARVDVPHFTLIGATTDLGLLSEPVRTRFQITLALESYSQKSMSDIVRNSFRFYNTEVSQECADMIAMRSRGIPRVANGYVRRVYDFAMVLNNGMVNKEIIDETFDVLDVNRYGLTAQDVEYLNALNRSLGKPLGLKALASMLNTDEGTIANVIEPYLMQNGYITRGARGRLITEAGKKVLL